MIWVETGSTASPIAAGDVRLHLGIDLRERADRPGNGAGRDLRARADEPFLGAEEFRIGIGELDAERRRLGMNAVGTPDRRRELVLEGTPAQRREQLVDIGDQQIGGAHQLHVEAGVEHVGGGHALMDEARLGAHDLGEVGEKGDHVVLDLALDRIDPRNVEGGVLALVPDFLGGGLRNDPELGERVGRMRLDLEPDAVAHLRVPDRSHFGPCVAWNHGQPWRVMAAL